jgi:lyso-ornithine lipid O-acyltransferase
MWRIALITVAIAAITVALIPAQWLSVRLRLPARRAIPVLYHRAICALLGVRITTLGARVSQRPLLIVANHVSWLDIPVLTAVSPVVFVAKREVATWPVFGLLARLQRSVFVDRTRRHAIDKVNAEIAERLVEGDPVVLFAEGTSNDGNRVLPFRTALIGAARDAIAGSGDAARVFIQPLSIAYTRLHGLPFGRQHRPVVAWYGSLDLLPHLGMVMRHGAIDVVVTWGEAIAYDGQTDRRTLAKRLEATVRRYTAASLCGHSFLPGKPLRGRQEGDARRDSGTSEAPECLETCPQARAAPIEVTRPA